MTSWGFATDLELETQYYWRVSSAAWASFRENGYRRDAAEEARDDMAAIAHHTASDRLREACTASIARCERLAA